MDEEERTRLRRELDRVLGPEPAATLERMLVTGTDETTRRFDAIDERFSFVDRRLDGIDQRLDGIDQRLDGMDQRLHGIDQRLDGIDQRLDGMDQRFDGIDGRLDGIDQRLAGMDVRFAQIDTQFDLLRHELLGAFRGELNAAVTAQTRGWLVATMTGIVGMGGLAVTLAQVL
ncbi:MAG: hypothetical protein JJT89_11300 [Nitriliruptoraceae bacterium]|nr:hypothetical protein [Nitriliruptoraceae bacterium]